MLETEHELHANTIVYRKAITKYYRNLKYINQIGIYIFGNNLLFIFKSVYNAKA